MLLKGKKAIVTGGARGIGKEIVLDFLKCGAEVYYIDLAEGEFLSEMEEAARAGCSKVSWKKGDVSQEEEISRVVEDILKESGGIDILVNNAGITRDGLIFRMTSENWEKVLRINLTSAFYISRIVARSMAKRRTGSIINMASVVGIGGNAGQANYSASKAGLIGLTKSLAKEVASRGVRVNAVAPGYIESDMTRALPEQAKEAMLSQIPLARAGQPRDVALAATFLASDRSAYITGQVLRVDGGMVI
jgi:3-oxoacyl-[acyl-carrier protein] reductase